MTFRHFYPFILVLGAGLFALFNFYKVPVTLLPSSVFFIILLIILFFEKKSPRSKLLRMSREQVSADALYTLGLLPLVTFFIEFVYIYFHEKFNFYSLANHFSLIIQFFIVLFVSEFLFYWYHRLSHEVNWLIKWHWFHHRENEIYWGNSGKFHLVDSSLQFSFYFIPIFLLSPSPIVSAAILTLSAVTGILEHANINYDASRMNLIFNTNDLHTIHHSKKRSLSDHNYGKITVLFDRVFGTYLKVEEVKKSTCPETKSNISLGYVGK